ncbi:alpha/beta hydrolase [Phytoactinopolyspora limicola]|uniref:alpha/beta hydrolase n=1 Tax=Phytoactinopolyspora limicola TaxID=2715536 RepID=UPI001FE75CC0|nr:alpha/beta hydrolase [Phytoactinopolyspora limicola]
MVTSNPSGAAPRSTWTGKNDRAPARASDGAGSSDRAPRPVPFDPELRAALALFKAEIEFEPLGPRTIPSYRERLAESAESLDEVIAGRPVEYEDRVIPGPPGAPDLTVLVLRPRGGTRRAPGMYAIHGGGMVLGTRFGDSHNLVNAVVDFGAVVVSVEYRLAPEHPHPAPVDDCYAGLLWTVDHAAELGIDPARLVIRGGSAGGGLGAAIALMARDRGGPAVAGQMLICPMIDDRNNTISTRQFYALGLWDGGFNETGWTALLGDARGGPDVPAYAAPARATDLEGLPPAFIEVGAAEVFRDESVDFASRIWAAGGQAELHVWAGAFHGFSSVMPYAHVSKAALAVRRSWLARMFAT